MVVPMVAGVAKTVGAVGPVVVAGVLKGDGTPASEVADGGDVVFVCEDWVPVGGLLRLL